jgi:hypothetical protein
MARPSDAMGWQGWDEPNIAVDTRCPVLQSYTQAQIDQMTGEVAALRKVKPDAVTPAMMRDYQVLRSRCRAYQQK